MSMRNYGIESKCFMLKVNEFANLIYDNIDNIKKLNKLNLENIKDLEDLDCNMIYDFTYFIKNACYLGEINGRLINCEDENKEIYIDNEDIIIIELDKDNLFNSYNNYNEIYEEIQRDLREVGIIVETDYIKKHFGRLSGSYYG